MVKRKHENSQEPHPPTSQGLPPPLPTDEESAELLVRELLRYDCGPKVYKMILNEHNIGVNFFNVEYECIAPHVGLKPTACMRDIETFPLYRARISTPLFKSIVEDINLLLFQYGSIYEHHTEEATSRLLSPIFNRLVAQFGGSIRNRPETKMTGSITTRGRIRYYFVAFGSVSILCVEAELRIGSFDERLDAVAQVIAECEGKASFKLQLAMNNHDCQACHHTNKTLGFFVPVHAILFDGESFQFFLFDGHATPPFSFKRGIIARKQSSEFLFRVSLSDLTVKSCHLFFEQLRPICEIMFDLLLSSYISSLDADHICSVIKDKKEQKSRQSTNGLATALTSARLAQKKFRDADLEHQNCGQSSATTSVTDAMKVFYLSIESIPEIYKTKSMLDSWNDEAVEGI